MLSKERTINQVICEWPISKTGYLFLHMIPCEKNRNNCSLLMQTTNIMVWINNHFDAKDSDYYVKNTSCT